jgi:hypothetical protein
MEMNGFKRARKEYGIGKELIVQSWLLVFRKDFVTSDSEF